MATIERPSTPPPPVGLRTPPTPRLGYHDNWEPFSPRKSARISERAAAVNRVRTPSPASAHRQQMRSPRTAKKSSKPTNASTSSPVRLPQKKRQPAADSVRRAASLMTAEGTSSSASTVGSTDKSTSRSANASAMRASGMLPTPNKTPQKPPTQKASANIKSFARNLFPVQEEEEETIPSIKKRRSKKYTGISLDSFTAEENEEPIEIFTDSQDRVPVKDNHESNPFFGGPSAPSESSKRRSKRRSVNIPGEGVRSVDEASGREDGMVYVFRGKKFFRKFSDYDDLDDISELEGEVRFLRPLTRSSIKPRLLFQKKKSVAMIEEEEAATDVEEDALVTEPETEPVLQTPVKSNGKRAATPEAPKFAPASPPDTRRVTRSVNKLQSSPMKATSRKSPFDSWQRTKEHKAAPATKRQGDELTSSQAKRTRT